MGKLALILVLFLSACSHRAMYSVTGHSNQSGQIERTLQHALEYNKDGVVSYWNDSATGKSGSIKPLHASTQWKGPCRQFQMTHYFPDRLEKNYYGVACRRDQVWQIH